MIGLSFTTSCKMALVMYKRYMHNTHNMHVGSLHMARRLVGTKNGCTIPQAYLNVICTRVQVPSAFGLCAACNCGSQASKRGFPPMHDVA
jgi:hypothetical protein